MNTPNALSPPDYLKTDDGSRLAYRRTEGEGPGVIFLHGLKSDMDGGKAIALEQLCRDRGRAFIRFDMTGHGQSDGAFTDGTISRWTEDALAVIDALTEGPQVLVGSSMGGWVMLRAALARQDRVAGLMGVAAAPDFTDAMWAGFSEAQKADLKETGKTLLPSDYDEPYEIAMGLIEDGWQNRVLPGPIPLTMPMRFVQGMRDDAVPYDTAGKLVDAVQSEAVQAVLIKDGDHRLSRPEDLKLLARTLNGLCEAVKP